MIKILFLYFHLPSSSAGYVLVTRWQPVRQGVNDDPVYAKVAAPNVEKLNFATSDSPTHDAFSSCGSSDVVVFQGHFHFGSLVFSSLFLEHFLSNFQVLFLLLLCH